LAQAVLDQGYFCVPTDPGVPCLGGRSESVHQGLIPCFSGRANREVLTERFVELAKGHEW
jgi:hypothetical protein